MTNIMFGSAIYLIAGFIYYIFWHDVLLDAAIKYDSKIFQFIAACIFGFFFPILLFCEWIDDVFGKSMDR